MCAARFPEFLNAATPAGYNRKLALVFGIKTYESGANLQNPVNDANDMERKLISIGFVDVTKVTESKRDEINSRIDSFVLKIRSTDLVLFYFAGHGVQWEDQNYLIPSDDKDMFDIDIKRRAINAQVVLDNITNHKPYVTIFLLDCCRAYWLRHPDLVRSSRDKNGLKKMYALAGAGALIGFSCAPGATASDGSGRNGLYTKHLLQHIEKPNEDIDYVLRRVANGVREESRERQIPWQNSSLSQRNIFLCTTSNGNGV